MNKEHLRRDRTENIIYLVLWATLFMAPVLGEYIQSTHEETYHFNWRLIFSMWSVYGLYFIAFLIHNFLVAPILIYRHRTKQYIGCLLATIAVFAIVQCSMHPRRELHQPPPVEKKAEWHPKHPKPDEPPPLGFIHNEMLHSLILFLIVGMNLGIKLYFKNERDRKKMHLLKSQTMEQQLERLRYQLNPHFFMNTLNNIHALVDIDPERSKQTIVDLSRLMRYVLYEGSKASVPLQRDIEFMQDYIRLMQIRYADKVRITTDLPSDSPDMAVPPMLFISFIENAFKHGISYQAASFIEINLNIIGDRLVFSCHNSIHKKTSEEKQGGIGLTNIRQRLDLLYPDDYSLDINETEKEYHVSLSITMKR